MPISTRFNKQDALLLHQHSELLLSLQNTIVEGFYDTLYQHPKTRKILKNTHRFKQEQVLGLWWHKTITSNFNEKYWEWQVYVGLVHIKHKITNPMMISMWGWMLVTLRTELKQKLPHQDIDPLMSAFSRLATTIQALTAESFFDNYVEAIESVTGFKGGLIDRMVSLQIDEIMESKAPNLSVMLRHIN